MPSTLTPPGRRSHHLQANALQQFFAELDENYEEAGVLLDYVFGVTNVCPDAGAEIHLSRVRGFVQRWATQRGLKFGRLAAAAPAALPGTAVVAAATAGVQSDQVKVLAASLAASDQRVAALQTQVAELKAAAPQRDGFVHRFGAERGGQLFAMGVKSLDEGERILRTAMSMGSSLGMARAALAQKLPK